MSEELRRPQHGAVPSPPHPGHHPTALGQGRAAPGNRSPHVPAKWPTVRSGIQRRIKLLGVHGKGLAPESFTTGPAQDCARASPIAFCSFLWGPQVAGFTLQSLHVWVRVTDTLPTQWCYFLEKHRFDCHRYARINCSSLHSTKFLRPFLQPPSGRNKTGGIKLQCGSSLQLVLHPSSFSLARQWFSIGKSPCVVIVLVIGTTNSLFAELANKSFR